MDQDAIERQVMQLFMKAGDRMMREALGLPPGPPPSPDPVLTLHRMMWDLLAQGRTHVEITRANGEEGIAFYNPVDDQIYFIKHVPVPPPSLDYVFEWPSGGHFPGGGHDDMLLTPDVPSDPLRHPTRFKALLTNDPTPAAEPPSVDVWDSNLSVHAEMDNHLHLNDDLINASVAYKQAGDPSWPSQPDEASSTSSTKTEPPRANRALRRHPGGPLDVPNPWRKPRWTRS